MCITSSPWILSALCNNQCLIWANSLQLILSSFFSMSSISKIKFLNLNKNLSSVFLEITKKTSLNVLSYIAVYWHLLFGPPKSMVKKLGLKFGGPYTNKYRTYSRMLRVSHCKKFVCYFLIFSEPRWVLVQKLVVDH